MNSISIKNALDERTLGDAMRQLEQLSIQYGEDALIRIFAEHLFGQDVARVHLQYTEETGNEKVPELATETSQD